MHFLPCHSHGATHLHRAVQSARLPQSTFPSAQTLVLRQYRNSLLHLERKHKNLE